MVHHLPVHRNCGTCCLLLQDAQDPDDALVHSACLKMGQLSPWPCRCQARSGRAGCTCCGCGCDCVHASASVPSAEAHQVWGGTVPEDLSAATHSVEHMSKMQDGLRLHSWNRQPRSCMVPLLHFHSTSKLLAKSALRAYSPTCITLPLTASLLVL